jgi:hypothetical protein
MTETEWLACDNMKELLTRFEWGTSPARKWRLFALACIELIRSHVRDARLTAALVEIARDAEGESTPHDFARAREAARAAHNSIEEDANEQRWFYIHEAAARAVVSSMQIAGPESVSEVAACCVYVLGCAADYREQDSVRHQANRRHIALVHEIFGNPFRPVVLDPLWLTFDVQALARGIYDEKAFDRMPILTDALQDAGCTNEDVLNHCRDASAGHVRGCWVIDLLLGKG